MQKSSRGKELMFSYSKSEYIEYVVGKRDYRENRERQVIKLSGEI